MIKFIFASLLNIFLITGLRAQTAAGNKSTVADLINSKSFSFNAQSMQPMSGRFRTLTSDYGVVISPDTLNSYLPYFGRAYVAPIGGSDNALDFISTSFNYKVAKGKKGSWQVTIVPNDNTDVRQLYFTISQDGYATLLVTSNNRQAISFNGVISERKQKRRQ